MSRNYAREYARYQGKPAQIRRRSMRNKARRLMLKKYGKSVLRGKDIHHVHGVGKGNASTNLRVVSVRKNRSYPRDSRSRPKRR
jgi:hypothetical protein